MRREGAALSAESTRSAALGDKMDEAAAVGLSLRLSGEPPWRSRLPVGPESEGAFGAIAPRQLLPLMPYNTCQDRDLLKT